MIIRGETTHSSDTSTEVSATDPEITIHAARRAATLAALGAATLAVCKLVLFLMTGSMVVALSAWDSALDVCVSALNQKVIHFARQQPDTNHPYGHGKAESMAALAQGALILGGAVLIVISSAQKLWEVYQGQVTTFEHSGGTAAFFIAAALASVLITRSLKRAARKYNSPALDADSEHYRTDVIANIASAISIAVIALTGKFWLDPLFAVLFALNIGWGGFKLLNNSINDLLDHDLPDEFKENVLTVIAGCSEKIIDIHNFRGRRSGHRYFFDFHITLPVELDFRSVHEITEFIEHTLEQKFDADVVIHADPSDENPNRIRTAPGVHRKLQNTLTS